MKVKLKVGKTSGHSCRPGKRVLVYVIPEIVVAIDYPIRENGRVVIDFVWIMWWVSIQF